MQLIAPHPDTRIDIPYHYTARALLTTVEAQLFAALDRMAAGRCEIVCKPRLADFITHHDGLASFNKISQKHVDFLICRQDDWMPMLGIELDDPSHENREARQKDMFKNSLFADVGLPLVRIHVEELHLMDALSRRLAEAWDRRSRALARRSEK